MSEEQYYCTREQSHTNGAAAATSSWLSAVGQLPERAQRASEWIEKKRSPPELE